MLSGEFSHKYYINSLALRADEKRRSAPGILPPPLEKILATPLPTCEYKEKDVVDRGLPPNHSNLI